MIQYRTTSNLKAKEIVIRQALIDILLQRGFRLAFLNTIDTELLWQIFERIKTLNSK